MVASAPPRISERFVAWVWQRQLVRGPLICDDGRPVQVVFPGRSWGEGQPDFQGALIAWPDGRLENGDIEIHVRPRDWLWHGHQRDQAYRNVVLHVVFHAGSQPTLNLLGQTVPTLALEPHLTRPLGELLRRYEQGTTELESPCQTDPAAAAALLDEAGLRRFRGKADLFEGDLSTCPPSELLWRGTARALGYTRNAEAMTRLAEKVSLGTIGELLAITRSADPLLTIYAALLGSARLLPSQRGLEAPGLFVEALEHAWGAARAVGWTAPVTPFRWEVCRVRPANHPVRRLAGLAALALWMCRDDPLRNLARLVLDERFSAGTLVRQFEVTAPTAEWASIVDLERSVHPPVMGLVGRDRAAEVVVNVVLPLLHALGRYWDNRSLEEAAVLVYQTFPRITSNGLARNMAEQIFGAEGYRLANTACRQQGLLHIFRTTCHAHACEICPARMTSRE